MTTTSTTQHNSYKPAFDQALLALPTKAEITRASWQRVLPVTLNSLAAGTTASAAVILGLHVVPAAAKLIDGASVTTPELLVAGMAAAGSAVFVAYSVSLLRSAARATGAFIPRLSQVSAVTRSTMADLTASRSREVGFLRACAFFTVPLIAVGIAPPVSALAFVGAAVAGLFAFLHTDSLATTDAMLRIAARDMEAELAQSQPRVQQSA